MKKDDANTDGLVSEVVWQSIKISPSQRASLTLPGIIYVMD